ncbi:hypothetical protein ASC77_25165 [Nocardioides sp. Root1257]|nr:hypothetical protein ASC77_25165 [Nocardioides sp. Root1257]KRC53747.1 hypothetical protein ASE24_24955 [Nocardioides sp. Root224]
MPHRFGMRTCGYRRGITNPAESPSTRITDDEPDTTPDDGDQVSEVASFGEPGEQVSPEDSVAGASDGGNGRADEGPTA